MIKLSIAIVVLLAAAAVWLRAQWARSRNNNAANEIIGNLQSGKYEISSYAEALGILILSSSLQPGFDPASVKRGLRALSGKKIKEVFTIQYADMDEEGRGIVIAEARSKDIVAGYGGNREVEIHFPCWLYIHPGSGNETIDFRSTFPENKEHHYLLEDLAGELYSRHFQSGSA